MNTALVTISAFLGSGLGYIVIAFVNGYLHTRRLKKQLEALSELIDSSEEYTVNTKEHKTKH